MATSDFKYDIAFSFTQKDEELAYELFKLLKNRLSCFIYSEEQKKLGGTDGEKVFNSVFSQESRIVVLLFSKDWGKTKWTRIEETAIKNKGFDHGYEFVILIPTEKNITPPDWMPKNRIWIGLDRWGIESAASAIETRVLEFEGTIKNESISDKAARIEKDLEERRRRELILDTTAGLELAFNEVGELIKEIKRHETDIKKQTADWHFAVRDNNENGCDILSYGFYLTFQFYQKYRNTPDGAHLFIGLFKGYYDANGRATDPFSKNTEISTARFRFDINEFNQHGWSHIETRKNFITSNNLVETWIEKLIVHTTKERMRRNQ